MLFLFAGVLPAFTQYIQGYQQPRYSDYEDFGRFNTEDGQQGPDFGVQQPSFFGSFNSKLDNDNHHISLNSGGYGGLTDFTPPPPTTAGQINNVHNYYTSDRRVIVPSSLRELEESYIRSLSTGNSASGKQTFLGPFGENRNTAQQQQQRSQQDGVENYSGFIMTRRHYNKNDHIRSSQRYQQIQNPSQNAPITYGFPLLNQQVSATNAIDAPFGEKVRGKSVDYSQKNIIPNFPDLPDRPPIPEEPEIPSEEDEVEEATRKPPERFALPNPPNFINFHRPSASPLASPPSIFDPSFPDPVVQRGFIPSFGPPTKEPIFGHKPRKSTGQELHHNHITSQVEVSTTSPVPVLRPEFSTGKDSNDVLPDEVSSAEPNPDEKQQEGTIYKHISVHVPAEDLEDEISPPKVIKVGKKPEKHIKVIFIKPPDSRGQKTEVEVPSGPQQKTLVYVLSESGGARTPIKLITPAPLKPAPPQVYFLRYTDPNTGASHPTPSSPDDERSRSPEEVDEGFRRPLNTTPPIKQLASPLDPDAEFLRSAPSPVLPTFPSGFSSPATTALARQLSQQLALQSTHSSPTTFTNTNYNNVITDPTNSKYQGQGIGANSLLNDQYIGSNHLNALKYTSTFPPFVKAEANTNPYSQNYYSSLHHLYPPPALASVPNQNLLSLYLNPNNYQQQSASYPQHYSLGHTKARTVQPTPSSIQGLYTVAPNAEENHSGINFNSLVQNPDGKNPPRSTRNFVMMNYAPTYMPSASGSDHVPVFTSPADFIKSLLGDSYMYYNNIANNSIFPGSHYNHNAQQTKTETTTTTTTTTPAPTTSTTTTTTTAPPQVKNVPQTQAQHHTIPLIYNWGNVHNLSRLAADHSKSQPFTLVIGSANSNANFHLQNGEPVYPHLRPLFHFSGSTTTPKPQPRVSWAPPTTTPPPITQSPNPIIQQLPVIPYISSSYADDSPHLTTADSVTSHFNNLFRDIQRTERTSNISDIIYHTSDHSAEYNQSESSSDSDESSSESGDDSDDQQISGEINSGEEIVPIYYESNRTNLGGESGYSSSITYLNSQNRQNRTETSSAKRGSSKSRKRVNPAHVKPGRRLRKVRKPPKSKKNKNEGNSEHGVHNHNS